MRQFLTSLIINDITHPDIKSIDHDIKVHVSMSMSYILLLISAGVVATLGLLLGSGPVVIGGMIISPLMWPLLKLSLGITLERESYIRQSIRVLLISIGIALVTSILVTYLSPLKDINQEILIRTNPTLIDMIIALVAGVVAAIGMIQPRISQSIAGVAIATSLMPPICVSGIGIALGQHNLSIGGFILFLSNVLAIVFACVLTFLITGVKPKNPDNTSITERSLVLLTVFMVFASIPLFLLLTSFVQQNVIRQTTTQVLQREFREISPAIVVENITVDSNIEQEDSIQVDVSLQVPPETTINFDQKQRLVMSLETALNQKVEINLILTPTISVISETDLEENRIKGLLQQTFVQEIIQIDEFIDIQSINIEFNTETWNVQATVNIDPAKSLTLKQRDEIERKLQSKVDLQVNLDIILIPRLELASGENKDQKIQQIRSDIQVFLQEYDSSIELEKASLVRINQNTVLNLVSIQIIVPTQSSAKVDSQLLQRIQSNLEQEYNEDFVIEASIIEKEILTV